MEVEVQVISSGEEGSESNSDSELSGIEVLQVSQPRNNVQPMISVLETPPRHQPMHQTSPVIVHAMSTPGREAIAATNFWLLPPDIPSNPALSQGTVQQPAPTLQTPGASILSSTSRTEASLYVLPTSVTETSTAQAIALNTSIQDFASPKRPKIQNLVVKSDTLAASSRTATTSNAAAEDDDEGHCCSICFEPWTNSGSHRLASLKCGHLFGQSCIEKWLLGSRGKCPQCNEKAKRKDIRIIYAKTLRVTDTSERDRALRDLEQEREARRTAELQAAESRLLLQMARDECRKLTEQTTRHQAQLNLLRSKAGSGQDSSPTKVSDSQAPRTRFTLEKTVKIFDQGGCRVMAYNPARATLCISQPSASPLFPGFGVKKLNVMDYKTSQYVSVHSKMIRDMAFSSATNLLLTASLDKTIKLTNLESNATVQTYNCPLPVWTCTWHSNEPNYFFAGMVNGTVHMFDMRNTAQEVRAMNKEGSKSPVVSMQYVGSSPTSSFSPGGLVVAQMERSSFYQATGAADFKLHLLPLEANLTSMYVDKGSRHLLATYRPSQRHLPPSVRHVLYELTTENLSQNLGAIDLVCSCNSIHTFHGGSTQKVLSRSRLLAHPSGRGGLVVAGDEATNSCHIWDACSGQLQQKVSLSSPVLDIVDIRMDRQYDVVALTDTNLSVLSWGQNL